MEILYVCPKCGHKCKVDAQQYEEVLSYADPHSPYTGEWLMCPVCYNIESVSDDVPVLIDKNGILTEGYLSADEAFLYLKDKRKENVKLWV